jgi:MFS family permease
VASVLLLAIVLGASAGVGAPAAPYLLVLLAVLGASTVAVSAWLWRRPGMQSGLAASLLSVLTGGGQVLASFVGAPGADASGWSVPAIGVIVLGLLVPALVLPRPAAMPVRLPQALPRPRLAPEQDRAAVVPTGEERPYAR